MGLEIRCDRCGRKVEREKACALILVQRAFSEHGKGVREQFELCPECREGLLICVNHPAMVRGPGYEL